MFLVMMMVVVVVVAAGSSAVPRDMPWFLGFYEPVNERLEEIIVDKPMLKGRWSSRQRLSSREDVAVGSQPARLLILFGCELP